MSFERVGEIEFEWVITAFVMAEVNAVAPAIGEEIGCPNGQEHAFVFPGVICGNFDPAPIPTDFVTPGRTMIFARDLEWIAKDARRIIVVISCGIAFAPGGKRFPAERHDDLFTPLRLVGREP